MAGSERVQLDREDAQQSDGHHDHPANDAPPLAGTELRQPQVNPLDSQPRAISRAEATAGLAKGEPVWVKGHAFFFLGQSEGNRRAHVTESATSGSRIEQVSMGDVDPIRRHAVAVAGLGLIDFPRVTAARPYEQSEGKPAKSMPVELEAGPRARDHDAEILNTTRQFGQLKVEDLSPATKKTMGERSAEWQREPPPHVAFKWPGAGEAIYRGEPMWYHGKPYRYTGHRKGYTTSVGLVDGRKHKDKPKWVKPGDAEPVSEKWVVWKDPDGQPDGFLFVDGVTNEQRTRTDSTEKWEEAAKLNARVRSGKKGDKKTIEKSARLEELSPARAAIGQLLSRVAEHPASRQGQQDDATLFDADELSAQRGQQPSKTALALAGGRQGNELLMDAAGTAADPFAANPARGFRGQDAALDRENEIRKHLGLEEEDPEKMMGPEAAATGATVASLGGAGGSAVGAIGDLAEIATRLRKGETLSVEQLISFHANSANVGTNLLGAGLGVASFFAEGGSGPMGAVSTGLNGVADALSAMAAMPKMVMRLGEGCKTVWDSLPMSGRELDLQTILATGAKTTTATLNDLLGLTGSMVSMVRWVCSAFDAASSFTGEFPIIGSALSIATRLLNMLVLTYDHLSTLFRMIRRAIANNKHKKQERGLREPEEPFGRARATDPVDPAAAATPVALDKYTDKLTSRRQVRDLESLMVYTTLLGSDMVRISADIVKIVSVAGAAPSAGASMAMYMTGTAVGVASSVTNKTVPLARKAIDMSIHMSRRNQKGVIRNAAEYATSLTELLQSDTKHLDRRLDYLDAVFDLRADELHLLLRTGDGDAGIRALQYYLFMRFWAIDSWKPNL